MKYLLWLLILLLVWWAFTRMRKRADTDTTPPPAASPNAPVKDMAVCLQCGVHLPREEAVTGSRGLYCSVAHRADANDHNPG